MRYATHPSHPTRRSTLAGLAASGVLGSFGPGLAQSRSGWWMPAEEELHQATFLQWPVNHRVHDDPVFLDMLQDSIAELANTIAEFEPVILLMPGDAIAGARPRLSGDVEIWDIPTDDLWARDSGPVFVRNAGGDLAVLDLNFNGWGRKQDHRADGQIARRTAERLGLERIDSGVVGEAGGLESDGHGTLMAHESSWVNDNRNPGMSRDEIEALLLQGLGAERMIWAPGLAGEDITDYHIDALARFVSPGHVLIQLPEEPDPRDPFSETSFETEAILRVADLRMTVIPEPWETRVQALDFVASYVNYYVCNGAVILAQFGDQEADRTAAREIAALYPGREIVQLNVDPIGEIGGGIHCATQQMPAV